MTLDHEILDRLAPASGWKSDWADVLNRAGAQHQHRSRRFAFPPRQRARRLLLIGVLAAGVIAIATPALGVISAIRNLFEGTPPTPLVQQHFMAWNQQGRRATHSPRWKQLQVNATKAHGVLAVKTSDGPVYLWVAPTRSGGTCWLLQYVHHKRTASEPIGPSGCLMGTAQVGSSIAGWGVLPSPSAWRSGVGTSPASFGILIGQAFGDANYVIVESARHRPLKVPVVEHFFVAVVAEPTIQKITSYDNHGKHLAESTHRNF